MNRFKFRVWNGSRMYYPSYNLAVSNCDSMGQPCISQGLKDCEYIENNSIIQQFTGLLDKNGKEIYEGDILLYKPSYRESEGGQKDNIVSEVKWSDGSFIFDSDILFQSDASFFEIIGNIYENSELLDKSEKSVKNI